MGYGNIPATTPEERVFVVIGMLVGSAIFAYVIGTVCDLVQGLMGSTIKFQAAMDELSEYMTTHRFPEKLRRLVRAPCVRGAWVPPTEPWGPVPRVPASLLAALVATPPACERDISPLTSGRVTAVG